MNVRKFFSASEAPWFQSPLIRLCGKLILAGFICKVIGAVIQIQPWGSILFYGGSTLVAVGIVLAAVGAISLLRSGLSGNALYTIISMCLGASIWYVALSKNSLMFTVPGAFLLGLGILETWNHAAKRPSSALHFSPEN